MTSSVGFVLCFAILVITTFEKFYEGGWVTILITSLFIACGLYIKRTYQKFKMRLMQKEMQFYGYDDIAPTLIPLETNKAAPTAAIIVDQTFGSGMNCLLEIKKLFPGIYKNFIFVTVGEVDSNTFREEKRWRDMRRKTKITLQIS